VLAGSVVRAGVLRVAVERTGERTRAAAIGRALIAATTPAPGRSAPTEHAEAAAERTVGPALATAGLGLLVGDLAAAIAILRPDYATGPGLAVPLGALRDVTACARAGLIVRDPAAFDRLGEVALVVLDDHPALRRAGLDVADARGRLPEPELLRYAASAFRHLDDDRADALAAACLARGLHRLDLEPLDLSDGVAVAHGRHRVRVRGAGGLPDGPLVVEVNGAEAGRVTFRRSDRPEAAGAVRRVRAMTGAHVALLSDRPRAEVAGLAAALGVNQVVGGLSPWAKAEFLSGCRGRGVRAAFVGDGLRNAPAAAEAHVAIAPARDDGPAPSDGLGAGAAGVVVLGGRLDRLDLLWDVARARARRARGDQAVVLVPNVACVAGAFLFGFTGMTSVVVSNLGTFGAYNRAAGSLRALDRPDRRRPGRWHEAQG
jgi:Cu2+-exporting ATPase